MLERLRMQEVSEIILSVPQGVNITGTNFKAGEPVLIVNKPSTSALSFTTRAKVAENGRGFLSASGQTNHLDFTINEGSIIYALWSYLHGTKEENTVSTLKGTEYLKPDGDILVLSVKGLPANPRNIILYHKDNNEKLIKLAPGVDYNSYHISDTQEYIIKLTQPENAEYFIVYDYDIQNTAKTTIKQIHNNIICSLDIYFDAMDMDTDEERKVCLHCDRVQIFTDLMLSINDSTQSSFTPIRITSIPDGNELNKDVAVITVI